MQETVAAVCSVGIALMKAAHNFDVFSDADIPDEHADNYLQQYEILDLYDTSNGITLCNECHGVFNALLCCVKFVVYNERNVL